METSALLQLIFRLGATAVLTIQKEHGDAKAGADKRTLAKDWLQGVTAGALSVLTGDKAQLAQEASDAANDAIDAGYEFTKNSGLYARATAQAKAKQLPAPTQPVAEQPEPIEDLHGIAG